MTQCELPIFAGKGDGSSVLEIAAKEADRPFTEHGGREGSGPYPSRRNAISRTLRNRKLRRTIDAIQKIRRFEDYFFILHALARHYYFDRVGIRQSVGSNRYRSNRGNGNRHHRRSASRGEDYRY